MANRLASESSPYLQQHAQNPVDWYPWGEEALSRARAEDRPILLSIGYSSCHWCHVMERESFEDPAVAELMNGLFVNVKVDREERPDVDQVYMKAVQAMTGGGGWPLTVWLTPDGVPFYGGTYFPPEPRHGIPSFTQVLRATADAFAQRRDAVVQAGNRLAEAISTVSLGSEEHAIDAGVLDDAYATLAAQYDPTHGGFGGAPKFPQPVTLEVLARHHSRTLEPEALEMLGHTLRQMAAGGLRDHLAGGFHRYSVDATWLVPHFEKMLYDNALLARAYLDAYRLTGRNDLREVCEQTLEYVLRDMRGPEGGFYSARDADSEGEEGRFYVWSADEVREVLGPERAPLFMRAYDVTDVGNFEGRNILHLPHELPALASALGMPPSELERSLAASREALREARSRREPPLRDEKTLVSWNAMAMRALAEAGAVLGRTDFVDAAAGDARFLWASLRRGGRLLHTYRDGEAKIPAFLDDHAALGNALLTLHGATLDVRWLDAARWLCEEILARFWSDEDGTLFDTPDDGEALLMRPRDPMDNATPSGVSLSAELFLRAGHVFGERRYGEVAEALLGREAGTMRRFGPAFGRMLSALDRHLAAPIEVAIVGPPEAEETRAMIRAAHAPYARNLTVVGRAPDVSTTGVPLLEDREPVGGRPTAWVCRGYECRLPVTDAAGVAAELADMAPGLF